MAFMQQIIYLSVGQRRTSLFGVIRSAADRGQEAEGDRFRWAESRAWTSVLGPRRVRDHVPKTTTRLTSGIWNRGRQKNIAVSYTHLTLPTTPYV